MASFHPTIAFSWARPPSVIPSHLSGLVTLLRGWCVSKPSGTDGSFAQPLGCSMNQETAVHSLLVLVGRRVRGDREMEVGRE